MTDFFLERKKNGQIQELINNMWLILSYTVQLVAPMFVPNFKILSQVVSEKSLTEKSLTNTHTQTEKAKTIYPLYTSYAGGINMQMR